MMWRKRPVEIEAMTLPEVHNIDGRLNFERWINKRLNGRAARWVGDWLEIETPEGVMKANVGDYVICGVAGELYPCKPHIFYATHERVTQ